MKIGIIGTGGIGQAFAKHAINAGYEITLSNSRGPDSLSEIVQQLGGKTKAGTVEEAAQSDVTFLAVPWKNLKQATSVIPSWKGRIVIDPSNPIIMPGFQIADLGERTSSEVVAEMLAGARLVKAFNTLSIEQLSKNPREANGRRVIFFSGNDIEARKIVGEIINNMGFVGVDLGELDKGGRLQSFPKGPLPSLDLIKIE